MTESHYTVELVLKRVDTTSGAELPLTEEQAKHQAVYGQRATNEAYALDRRQDKVTTVEVARATLNADKVSHLTGKVAGLMNTYHDDEDTGQVFIAVPLRDALASSNSVAESSFPADPPMGMNENPNRYVEPDVELADALDEPTTEGKRIRKAPVKKAVAKKAPARRGRPPLNR